MMEFIIKIGDEPDINGGYPLKEQAKEFIRCKDCRHYDGYICKHEVRVRSRKPDWYCADAWKKEEKDDEKESN